MDDSVNWMGLCFLVNVPLVWEVFIKKHKVENGVLKYGVLNDDIVLKEIRIIRQVGKSLKLRPMRIKYIWCDAATYD